MSVEWNLALHLAKYFAANIAHRRALPSELSEVWKNVSEITCAAFGPKKDSYLMAYINKSEEFHICTFVGLFGSQLCLSLSRLGGRCAQSPGFVAC